MTQISRIHRERPEDDPDIQISRYPGSWISGEEILSADENSQILCHM